MNPKLTPFLLLVGLTTIFDACSDSNSLNFPSDFQHHPQVRNGRIVFRDEAEAAATFSALSEKSQSDLASWQQQKDFYSLSSLPEKEALKDSMFIYFTRELVTVLNVEREYQVGTTIIWFYGNSVFKVPNSNELLLAKIKNEPNHPAFTNLREDFVASRNIDYTPSDGRAIPNHALFTPSFNLTGTRLFRFVRSFYNINTGIGYTVELWNYLQYKSIPSGTWCHAGEPVDYRFIGVNRIVADPNVTWTPENQFGELYSSNGVLKVRVATSRRVFAGTVTANFVHNVGYKDRYFSFDDEVTFK